MLAIGLAFLSAQGALAEAESPEPNPPPPARYRLLPSVLSSMACYPWDLTEQELEVALERTGLLPPTLAGTNERFFTDTKVWTGQGMIGDRDRAMRAHLTYSFPNDGVNWGLAPLFATGPNTLNSNLEQAFGAPDVDKGRELIRQAFAAWRRVAGLTYQEVADDNAAYTSDPTPTAARGDIRIGALAYPGETFLAYNAFPSAQGQSGTGGGDMTINTIHFTPDRFNNPLNNYRYLRNTMAHEHGHGVGAIHTTPCNNTKLMEPFISLNFETLAIDDIRGAGRSYGDRFSGNQNFGTAHDLGNLTTPVLRSAILRNLSTNGFTGAFNSREDWFRFTIDSTQTVVITVTPTGGAYLNGQQTAGCSPTNPPSINASQAGDLSVALLTSNGQTVLASASAAGPGATEILNAGSRTAGTYLVRITDGGPNANQDVQLYDLTLRIGAAVAPPDAIAGLNKRIQAGVNCYFMGDINSSPTEPGATITSYDWDLDGNGSFEVLNTPQPVFQYPSSGFYNATLRVTDSNGMTATDTIVVAVFGAGAPPTTAPTSGAAGTTVPVTIHGSNFLGVSAPGHVAVSGTGVSVVGTPTVSPLGDQITGLAFEIAPGSFPSARDVTVVSFIGPQTGTGVFTVTSGMAGIPGAFSLVAPALGALDTSFTPTYQWGTSAGAFTYEFTLKRDTNDDGVYEDTLFTETGLVSTMKTTSPPGLRSRTWYLWSVVARNTAGTTLGQPSASPFRTRDCIGDANYDRVTDFADITATLSNWGAAYVPGHTGLGDANFDSVVNFDDITSILSNWLVNCQ